MRIRAERSSDSAAISAVNEAAFGGSAEADLVETLRHRSGSLISLVAEAGGAIVGHILFSPVQIEGHPDLRVSGLAPMAVRPEAQRRGVGSNLVRAGLDACASEGIGAVVVLGHADYYPRFGFRRADRFGIRCPFDAPAEAFMVQELRPHYLAEASGTAHYHAAFSHLA